MYLLLEPTSKLVACSVTLLTHWDAPAAIIELTTQLLPVQKLFTFFLPFPGNLQESFLDTHIFNVCWTKFCIVLSSQWLLMFK